MAVAVGPGGIWCRAVLPSRTTGLAQLATGGGREGFGDGRGIQGSESLSRDQAGWGEWKI